MELVAQHPLFPAVITNAILFGCHTNRAQM